MRYEEQCCHEVDCTAQGHPETRALMSWYTATIDLLDIASKHASGSMQTATIAHKFRQVRDNAQESGPRMDISPNVLRRHISILAITGQSSFSGFFPL